ncbi:MAG TPA: PAS domain S-box protein, partial [Roseiflexaceae bacterium]
MIEPPVPVDEPKRLAALRDLRLLDTPAEERFDRITRMATRLFDTPIALISLVDAERQWFKSRQGISMAETARKISFCGHAILGDEIFVVSDALLDPRFADSPLVVGEPHVRFYAAQPLTAPDGSRVGTLCIIDRRPRAFGAADWETLRDLGCWVERELQTARLQHALDLLGESEQRYRSLVAALHEGIVLHDSSGAIQASNASAERILGLPVEQMLGRTSIDSRWRAIQEDGTPFPGETHPAMVTLRTGQPCTDVVMGVRRPDGALIWILVNTQPMFRDGAAQPYAVVCSFADITKRVEAEAALRDSEGRYRLVVDNIKEVIFQTDAAGRWIFLNHAWAEITGFAVEESLGEMFLDYVHPDDRQRNQELFQPLIERKKEYCRHEIRYLTKDGGFRWIEVFARLTLDTHDTVIGTSGTLRDITERHQMEEALRASEATLRGFYDSTPFLMGVIEIVVDDLVFIAVNKAGARRFDRSQEALRNQPFSAIGLNHEQLTMWIDHCRQSLRSGGPVTFEYQRRLGSGTRWRSATVGPIAGRSGDRPRFAYVVEDITERKRADEALRENAQRLEAIIATQYDVAIMTLEPDTVMSLI